MEGMEYIYMEDIPVREYHAFQHFVEIELSPFQYKLLQQLALKRGCSARKMAYTVLHFMLKHNKRILHKSRIPLKGILLTNELSLLGIESWTTQFPFYVITI